jgi:hypothetical protein
LDTILSHVHYIWLAGAVANALVLLAAALGVLFGGLIAFSGREPDEPGGPRKAGLAQDSIMAGLRVVTICTPVAAVSLPLLAWCLERFAETRPLF